MLLDFHIKMDFLKFCKPALLALFIGNLSSSVYALTLIQSVNQAISTNPQILAAEQNRQSIDQVRNQAKAAYYPHIKTTVSYAPTISRNSNTIAAVLSGSNPVVTMPARNANLTVDQMLFDGFATSGEVARNTSRADSAAFQLLTTIQDTAMNTIQDYFDILREYKLVALSEKNIADHFKILHTVELRTKQGVASRVDLVQVQGRLALAKSNLFAEQSNLQDAMARYRHMVGDMPHDLTLSSLLPESVMPHSENEALEYAVTNHPTIRSAEADIQAAYYQRQVAKAPNYPRIDLQLGVDRNRNVGGTRGPDFDQFILAKFSYDLFSGGATISKERETEHLLQQAHEIRNNSYRQALEDTKFSWDLLKTGQNILPLLIEHEQSSKITIGAYKKQFELGKRTLIDVLDIQNELYAASRAYIEGDFKVRLAQYQLLHSMGKLVQTLASPLPTETVTYTAPPSINATSVIQSNRNNHHISVILQKAPPPTEDDEDSENNNQFELKSASISKNELPEKNTQPAPVAVSQNEATEKIAQPPVSAPVDKKISSWVIQMGVFKNQLNVQHLIERLRALGYNAFTKEKKLSDLGNNTAVYIGPQSKQDSAIILAKKVEHEVNIHGIVQPYEPIDV